MKSGDDGEEVTPVPIPNTAVKLFCADGTWGEAPWESRSSPVSKCSKVAQWWSNRLLTGRLWVRVPPLEPFITAGVAELADARDLKSRDT